MHHAGCWQIRHRTHLTFEILESRDCPSAYSIIDLIPPDGSSTSSGLGLNDQGLVAGQAPLAGYVRAAVWQTGARPTADGTHLPVLGTGIASNAYDVNNSGMIVGFSTQLGNDPAQPLSGRAGAAPMPCMTWAR